MLKTVDFCNRGPGKRQGSKLGANNFSFIYAAKHWPNKKNSKLHEIINSKETAGKKIFIFVEKYCKIIN